MGEKHREVISPNRFILTLENGNVLAIDWKMTSETGFTFSAETSDNISYSKACRIIDEEINDILNSHILKRTYSDKGAI